MLPIRNFPHQETFRSGAFGLGGADFSGDTDENGLGATDGFIGGETEGGFHVIEQGLKRAAAGFEIEVGLFDPLKRNAGDDVLFVDLATGLTLGVCESDADLVLAVETGDFPGGVAEPAAGLGPLVLIRLIREAGLLEIELPVE